MPFTPDDPHTQAVETYDPAKLLTRMALLMVLILVLFICLIIGWQIFQKGEANTESWAALTGIVGWATGVVGMLFSNRFGSTQQSATKDATIARQAQTAAVVATAAAPAAAAAVAKANGGTEPPILTDVVNVSAGTANITEKEKPL